MGLNYKLVWCVVLVICSFAVSASSFDSLRMEKQGDQFFIIHKVEQGETLYSLARRYGCELPAIKSANNLPDNNIDLGQELRIPTNGSLADKTAITTSEVSEEVTSAKPQAQPGEAAAAKGAASSAAIQRLFPTACPSHLLTCTDGGPGAHALIAVLRLTC